MRRTDLLRLFCFGFDGTAVPERIRSHLEAGLRAVILFARNLRDLDQVCRLTSELRQAGALLIGVDQEGGRVVRLPAPFTVPPPAAAVGALDDPDVARRLAALLGQELRAAGFTWNLVPVLDVHTNPRNPIIGDRAFGADPRLVARLGIAVIQGFGQAGILTTAKHFPGHGDSSVDSHLTLPVCGQPRSRWDDTELAPFREAIRAAVPAIMIAHLQCPALDPDLPTSLSHAVITGLLRRELGFDGLVVCDDLEMAAITAGFEVGEAAVRFLEAGGDLILICRRADYQEAALRAVEEAARSRRLSPASIEAALDRVASAIARVPPPGAADPAAVRSLLADPSRQGLVERVLAAYKPQGPDTGQTKS